MTLKIESPSGRTSFQPGEEIALRLSWQLTERCNAIELRLLWHTSGRGEEDFEVAHTVRYDAPTLIDQRDTTIPLPAAPYSFSGSLITLAWALELVTVPESEHDRLEIVLAPEGREVTFHEQSL